MVKDLIRIFKLGIKAFIPVAIAIGIVIIVFSISYQVGLGLLVIVTIIGAIFSLGIFVDLFWGEGLNW